MKWSDILSEEKEKPYFKELMDYLVRRRAEGVDVFPPAEKVFSAFKLTPLEQLKIVILGQDPYHGPGQAHGLCFSVETPQRLPPSLRNIFSELEDDLSIKLDQSGNLSPWAKQGVLLLNTVLTVESGQANSHKGIGWETFTDKVIAQISTHCEHLVFILWGAQAIKKSAIIDKRHSIITSPHPSPLSAHRGFFGSKPFSKANQALIDNNITPIDWSL